MATITRAVTAGIKNTKIMKLQNMLPEIFPSSALWCLRAPATHCHINMGDVLEHLQHIVISIWVMF